jgi:hypothetical protein
MKPVLLLAALCLSAAALPADAGNGHCPPGLAKKSPACVPPGQAKKYHRGPRIGDRVSDYHYHLIRYPDRYDLPPLRRGERYYVIDGQILRVDQDTYKILDFIRATAALLD